MSNLLNPSMLTSESREIFETMNNEPVTILQIGEGNFLRGFVDWMIYICRSQRLFRGSIAVTQPRPAGKANIDKLIVQNGIYTLVTQGMDQGSLVMKKETIQVFSQMFDPYAEWSRLIELAISPDLRFIVSNTTEAGLTYRQEELTYGQPILSYPGKIAYLLHERYQAFQGNPEKGLILLPCELLERNGDVLKAAVLRYAEDWHFSASFRDWINKHNRFLNSLVDRIVTGYPDEEQAEAWFEAWGYRDSMLCTAEPYHLWAIEAEEEMEALLPFRKAGLNVHWTKDLTPFQQQKVRILNGSHTWMAPLGLLNGIEHVREFMEHPQFGEWVRNTVLRNILPTLPYDEEELHIYAKSVFDRFGNPYINHRLADIAMNSISKFRTRLLPSIAYYIDSDKEIPEGLVIGVAGLLRYYKVILNDEGVFKGMSLNGSTYVVRDDVKVLESMARHWASDEKMTEEVFHQRDIVNAILADKELWGQDLSAWRNLSETVAEHLECLERGGINE
ncbi:tagaturonate reductase [Paenibacillus sp. EC2-1]|uniref:tagaturonate reductase n=1 Tax=Paenibacillus sp. EC2-1 TaxID=3388665 RepID=UPI003BEF49D6